MSVACPQCDEVVTSEHGLLVHKGRKHKDTEGGAGTSAAPPPPAPPDPDGIDESSPYAGAAGAGRTSPTEKPPQEKGWREKVWGDTKRDATPKTPRAQRRPRPRRIPTDELWATGCMAIGYGLVQSSLDVPVGNCLQFQSAVVGPILDDAVAGTAFDAIVLQRLAGSGERLKKVSSVVLMPVLVAVLERNPAAGPVLEPILRQVIREHITAMAPVVKARQKADEQYKKALTDLGMDPGDDPIDAVIDAIFPRAPAADTNGAGTYNHAASA